MHLITPLVTKIFLSFCLLCYPLICLLSGLYSLWRIFLRKPKYELRKGDVAVVTGAGHGLGKAFAHHLARRGCTVCVVDINAKGAEQVVEELKSQYKVKAKAYVTDVSKFEEVERLHAEVKQEFGNTTVLVNNAGILLLSSFFDPQPEEIQKMIDVNLTAHLWTTKVFLPDMKQQKRGHIIAISSMLGLFGFFVADVYCTAKFGVRGFMQSLRRHLSFLGQKNITGTTVMPFFIFSNTQVVNVVRFLKANHILEIQTTDQVVERSIQGMLNGESEVVVPAFFAAFYKFIEFLPSEIGDFVFNKIAQLVNFGGDIRKFDLQEEK